MVFNREPSISMLLLKNTFLESVVRDLDLQTNDHENVTTVTSS